jgi:hypothetical protein
MRKSTGVRVGRAKVRLVHQAGPRWTVWVEGERDKETGLRTIRIVDIDGETRKVLDYRTADNLPDSALNDSALTDDAVAR